MDIASVIKAQIQLAQLGSLGSVFGAGEVSQALAPANERLSRQLESTNVRLSAYGRIESAFDSARSAADSLADKAADKTVSNADLVKAAQAFVSGYNQALQTARGAVKDSGSQPGALASDLRASMAGNALARTFDAGTGLADLKLAGLSQDRSGKLTLDTKALEQALQSDSGPARDALARLGQQADATVGKELADTGNLGRGIDTLTYQSKLLSAQQSVLGLQASVLQSALDQQSAVFGSSAANGLALYQYLLQR